MLPGCHQISWSRKQRNRQQANEGGKGIGKGKEDEDEDEDEAAPHSSIDVVNGTVVYIQRIQP